MTRPLAALLAVLVPALGLARPSAAGERLADGGFPIARTGTVRPSDPAWDLRMRLPGIRFDAVAPAQGPRPKALGDRLILSVDDDGVPIGDTWESRLDVSAGPAGPSDAVAVRFPAESLSVAPPFDVASVVVGLDDRHGVTSWPVELWLEDPATPLQPRRGAATASGVLDAGAAGMQPTTETRPTAFQRVAVPLRLSVPDAWLSDAAFDDDFERTAVPLGDMNWVECEDSACGTLNVFLTGGRAVRQTGGGRLMAVRFPASAQEQQRPHRDLDLHASVRVVDSAATFSRAGLALRVLASDAFYRVEYQKAPSQVVVTAVLPAPIGEVAVGMPLAVSTPSTGSRLLEVTVTGLSPAVEFAVSVDGTPIGTITDTTWRLGGWAAGLSASDPASSGEAWDDFRIERRPDVFAVIGFPAGEDVGLPLDVSDLSLASQSILLSSDGATFAPLGLATGCANPGNPFVQLQVEDAVTGSALFRQEARVSSVELGCPTCTLGVASCPRNLSVPERMRATVVPGEPVSVRARWWNEGLQPAGILLRGTLWSGPCEAPGAALSSQTTTGLTGDAQATALRGQGDVFSFVAADPGPHCVTIEVLHDGNGDCCPDGEETTPLGGCAGACTPVAPSDSNGATRWTLVDVAVAAPCDLSKGEDVGRDGPDDLTGDGVPDEINLDGASLRVAKGSGDEVVVTWARNDTVVFPAIYNVHVLREPSAIFEGACFLEQAPVIQRVVGATGILVDLPLVAGEATWLAVNETDGCAGGASVIDSSADDPALLCP